LLDTAMKADRLASADVDPHGSSDSGEARLIAVAVSGVRAPLLTSLQASSIRIVRGSSSAARMAANRVDSPFLTSLSIARRREGRALMVHRRRPPSHRPGVQFQPERAEHFAMVSKSGLRSPESAL
jgi:hypothetical protein